MKAYFTQYGEVLDVKVARSKITARSKGYGFVQFKYPEVAEIVSDTMNGYLLMGKVLISSTLSASQKNPFSYSTSRRYQFINWKRLYAKQKNEVLSIWFRQKLKNRQPTSSMAYWRTKRKEDRNSKALVLTTSSQDLPTISLNSSLKPIKSNQWRQLRRRQQRIKENDKYFMYEITIRVA